MDIQKMVEARNMLIEWGFSADNATLLLVRTTFGLSLEEAKTLFCPSQQEHSNNPQQPIARQGA